MTKGKERMKGFLLHMCFLDFDWLRLLEEKVKDEDIIGSTLLACFGK